MTTVLVLGLLGLGGSGSAQQQPTAVYDPNNPPGSQYDPNAQPPQYDPNAQPPQYDPNGNPYGTSADYDPNSAAPQYGYFGVHPVPYEMGNGLCPIEGAHFHEYPPFDQYLFRQAGGFFYFVGDVGDFGYAGQMWGYQANHPIAPEFGGGYCFINWPHRHHYPPPTGLAFNYIGGYYVYVGPWAPSYYRYRDGYWGYFGSYYRNNYYGGRYWAVRPRPVYRPAYTVGAPGVYRAGVTVRAPGGRQVVVTAPRRAGVYVPPPVRPGVREAPPPVRAGVYVPPPVRPGGRETPPPVRAGVYTSSPPEHAAPPPATHGSAPAQPVPARRSGPPPSASPPPRRHH